MNSNKIKQNEDEDFHSPRLVAQPKQESPVCTTFYILVEGGKISIPNACFFLNWSQFNRRIIQIIPWELIGGGLWELIFFSGPMAQRIEALSLYGSRWALSEDSGFKSYLSRPEVYLVKNVVR